MKKRIFSGLILLMAMAVTTPAMARISFSTGLMGLTNSTKQGGQGAEGSTILTQTDFTYHGSWWGAGLYFQYDKQGTAETDIAAGPRLEATWNPFFIEYGYAVKMNRSFTDRAIKEQEGKGYTLGVGARFPIGASAGGGAGGATEGGVSGAFLQFSYKFRTQQITTQDGEELDEPITQTDGYPLFSIGFGF